MRIHYITNVRLPTAKAQGYAIMKMCSEFARAGVETHLCVPEKHNNENKQDPFEYYGIQKNFTIEKIPSTDLLGRTEKYGRIFYWIDVISFLIMLKFATPLRTDDVLYTRDFVLASFFPRKRTICLELHAIPKSQFFFKRAIKKATICVVLNSHLRDRLVALGVERENILISPSAVDMDRFALSSRLVTVPVPEHDFVYGHIGTLKTMGMDKGVTVGLEALALLPVGYTFLIVGGEPEEVAHYRDMSERLGVSGRAVFVGKVPYADVALYGARCDVLVAPFPENEHYSFFMSPLKIFEYMASKKPIITTNLPSIREILTDGENAVLVPPHDPRALADAIVALKSDPDMARRLVEKAYALVSEKYTWQKRVEHILACIRKATYN